MHYVVRTCSTLCMQTCMCILCASAGVPYIYTSVRLTGERREIIRCWLCSIGFVFFIQSGCWAALDWSRTAVSLFFITFHWFAPRFLTQAGSFRNTPTKTCDWTTLMSVWMLECTINVRLVTHALVKTTGWAKKRGHKLMIIILSNLNRFTIFFHWKGP